MKSMLQVKSYYEIIVAGLALATAIGSGWVAVATRTTPSEVEHIVEIKSTDKFAEIQRRLDAVDRNQERIIEKLDNLVRK